MDQQEQLDLPNKSPINNAVPTTSNETTADNQIIKTTIPEVVSPEPQANMRRSSWIKTRPTYLKDFIYLYIFIHKHILKNN